MCKSYAATCFATPANADANIIRYAHSNLIVSCFAFATTLTETLTAQDCP